jgi:hypothetical protein
METVSYRVLWDPISAGIDNTIRATKLAIKDIWGSLKYTFNITFALDEEKIKRIKKSRAEEKERYAQEYATLWRDLKATNPDFYAIAFVASPALYLSTYLTLNGGKHAIEVKKFIKDNFEFDIDVPTPTMPGEKSPSKEKKSKEIARRVNLLLKNTQEYTTAQVLEELDVISGEINKLLSLSGGGIYEGVYKIRLMIEEVQAEKSPNDFINVAIENVIEDEKFKKEISKKVDSSKMLALKKQELDSYIKSLSAPVNFIKAIQKATGLDDIVSAYKSLGSTLLRIEDFDFENPKQKIEAIAKENYNNVIKNKKQIAELLKAAEINVDITTLEEKQKKNTILSAIIKLQTLKEVERVKEFVTGPDFLKSLEPAKEEFIKSFTSDVDEKTLNIMKKNAPNDEYVKLMTSGIEAIRNVGLRK